MALDRTYSDEEFILAVKTSHSYAQILVKLNLKCGGGSYDNLKKIIKRLNLNIDHFKGQGWRKNKKFPDKTRKTLEKHLVENSNIPSYNLKLKLFDAGLKEKICEECGIIEWREKPAPLELDHINGDRFDNRLENLRILCANCHAQTETYCGKNKRKLSLTDEIESLESLESLESSCPEKRSGSNTELDTNYTCIDCGKQNSKKALRCKSCASYFRIPEKIKWPLDGDLIKMVKDSSFTKVSKHLGVSDNAIRKRLKRKGIENIITKFSKKKTKENVTMN